MISDCLCVPLSLCGGADCLSPGVCNRHRGVLHRIEAHPACGAARADWCAARTDRPLTRRMWRRMTRSEN